MSKVKRSYHQFCGLAKGLDVIGERWTLLIVRDLLLGPRRYTELLEGLPGITTNLLAKRLKEMEENGLLAKKKLTGVRSYAYELTELGWTLEPVVLAVGRFGWQFMTRPGNEDRLDLAWSIVSLKRRWQGDDGHWVVSVETPDRLFQIRPDGARMEARLGEYWHTDVTVAGTDHAFRQLFFLGFKHADMEAEGSLKVTGDYEIWDRCCKVLQLQ